MGVNEIKKEIGKFESSIELESQKLDELRQRIKEETKPFIKVQLKENVEKEVKSNSEHTKELGRERLSAMKQQLTALLDNSDNLVEEMYSDDGLWIHVNYEVGDDWSAYAKRKMAEENIHKAIKTILGEAGKLLIENDYIKAGTMYQWDSGAYRSFNFVSSNSAKPRLLYRGPFRIPEALGQLIGTYTEEIKTLNDLYVKVLNLKRKLSEQEAVDLWDEV